MYLPVQDVSPQVKRREVGLHANGLRFHRFPAHRIVTQEHPVPHEVRGHPQLQVVHQIAVRVNLVHTAARHEILAGLHKLQNRRLLVKLQIYRQCFDKHALCTCQSLVAATIVDRVEQGLFVAHKFGQQKGIRRCEKSAFKDAFFAAKSINILQSCLQDTAFHAITRNRLFQIGDKFRTCVTTVEMPGIPLFPLLKSR